MALIPINQENITSSFRFSIESKLVKIQMFWLRDLVEVGLALEVEVEEAGLALQPYSVVLLVSLLDVQNLGVCKTTFVQPATRTITGRSRFNIDVKTTNYSYQPTDQEVPDPPI